ncbi:MAG: D-glycero-beta-D-manno-heptose-7-phosphate kinase [Mucilaginibacter sp.]
MNLIEKVRLIQQSGKTNVILVIGDLMIDHYIWGGATRLSPEAPVPIVTVNNESTTLGGAGNLAQNLVSLGANVILAGIIGDDEAGKQVCNLLKSEGVETDLLLMDTNRPTTVKTRVLAGIQQLVRIDRELTDYLALDLETKFIEKIAAKLDEVDIVVFSDYGKGLFSPHLTQTIIKIANSYQKKVIIDPKGLNYAKYKDAYIIKPNKKELAEAAKSERLKNVDEIQEAARTIFGITAVKYLVVTMSDEGIAIISEKTFKQLPVKASEVFDVTGAGDTVLAAMAYFIASGFTVEESCELANHAAAIVIKRLGSASTTIGEIIDELVKSNILLN